MTCIADMVDNNDGSRKGLESRLLILVVGQPVDWLDESEVLREELGSPGQHQLVALLQSGFGHSCNGTNLSMHPRIMARLGGHVDGSRGDRHGGLPLNLPPSLTFLNSKLALSKIVFGKLILSAILLRLLNALMRALSLEATLPPLVLYKALPMPSKLALPVAGPMRVVRSELPNRVFSAAPTRLLSSFPSPLALLKDLHSELTSITLSPTTNPHSEQIWSPAL